MIEMERDALSKYPGTPARLGSDDPSMRSEAQDLLSKFTRYSSREAQDTSKKPGDLQIPPINPTAPKVRGKIRRGNAQLRPQAGASAKPVIALPMARRKPLSPSSSESPSPDRDIPRPAVTRRPRRARAEPVNYYKKISLPGSESEEVQAVRTKSISRGLSRSRPSAIPSLTSQSPLNRGDNIKRQDTSVNSLLQRELGSRNLRLNEKCTSDLRLSKAWKGASNDVVSLAWSPDGTKFAAGATAQCDEHMMAYNRKNNLLLGDLVTNELHELPDHWIQRPKNSVVNDPRLFMSVTTVQWFEDTLYTASYDHTVKLWDTSRGKASCYKTLKHDSKVVVMARSNFVENLLATGTYRNTVGYWDISKAQYTALELQRGRSRKDIELMPTSIAWGSTHATKDYLLVGMSEKEDSVAQHGLLATFRVRESSIEPESFSPNSQNVFDITWHPVLPMFAIACAAGQQTCRGTRSTVNLYEPLSRKTRVMELECPALDMNEVVFCPWNTNYISAGCTDGVTYVWDKRNPDEILHRLGHGDPLNQLDETIDREQADTGVNMQLWGIGYDLFYTGASDGMVKRWNILRAPEDALVQDVASLQEGIMCGAFSPDRSNLLIGDVSGGVHLLSNSPFMPDESTDFSFKESPYAIKQESDSDSGVMAARDLMKSGQIQRHPVFGPGQGPYYRGPFAAWARPTGTQPELMAATALEPKYEIRQLGGIAPKHRKGLNPTTREEVEGHITLARIRNQKHGGNKRRNPRVTGLTEDIVIDLCSEPGMDRKTPGWDPAYDTLPKRRYTMPKASSFIISNVEPEVIDLTGDSEAESPEGSEIPSGSSIRSLEVSRRSSEFEDEASDLEDDFWWPDSSKVDPNFTE
ncbi:WD40-repeat-containing domain protein [Aspergillus recurvatus]